MTQFGLTFNYISVHNMTQKERDIVAQVLAEYTRLTNTRHKIHPTFKDVRLIIQQFNDTTFPTQYKVMFKVRFNKEMDYLKFSVKVRSTSDKNDNIFELNNYHYKARITNILGDTSFDRTTNIFHLGIVTFKRLDNFTIGLKFIINQLNIFGYSPRLKLPYRATLNSYGYAR